MIDPFLWLHGALPAWLVGIGAGWMLAGGAVLGVYGLFRLAPYAGAARLGALCALFLAGFLGGVASERTRSETVELKTQIRELEGRLELMDVMAEAERIRANEEAAFRTMLQGELDVLLADDQAEVQASIAAAAAAVARGEPPPPPPDRSRVLGPRARRVCDLSGAICRD